MGHAETCSELKNIFAALVKQSKPPESSLDALDLTHCGSVDPEVSKEPDVITNGPLVRILEILEAFKEPEVLSNGSDYVGAVHAGERDISMIPEVETDSKSNQQLNQVGELGD